MTVSGEPPCTVESQAEGASVESATARSRPLTAHSVSGSAGRASRLGGAVKPRGEGSRARGREAARARDGLGGVATALQSRLLGVLERGLAPGRRCESSSGR